MKRASRLISIRPGKERSGVGGYPTGNLPESHQLNLWLFSYRRGTISYPSNERLVTSYIKDVLARTGDVVFGLTPEDTRKITPLVVE